MSRPLSTANELSMRKDLVRLRMEMHRQQMLYHAQPLSHTFDEIKNFVTSRRSPSELSSSKGPLMVAATVVLALFGRRMGKVGKLARVALTLYPLIKGQQKLREKLH
jgi:hypothetical protein